jgi:hypothetical protein
LNGSLSLIFLVAVIIAEIPFVLCRQSQWHFIVSWAFITEVQFIIVLSFVQSQNIIFWSWHSERVAVTFQKMAWQGTADCLFVLYFN